MLFDVQVSLTVTQKGPKNVKCILTSVGVNVWSIAKEATLANVPLSVVKFSFICPLNGAAVRFSFQFKPKVVHSAITVFLFVAKVLLNRTRGVQVWTSAN